jgi:ADP-heptose:LPS heptosyltransferase
MGYGDELMATGLARGARDRGELVAFGDGQRIRWSPLSAEMFARNPNIAEPGSEGSARLRWVAHYPSARAYHARPSRRDGHWRYNYSFRATPGELFYTAAERDFADGLEGGFILIEPTTKRVAPNKQWPIDRWRELADRLSRDFDVVQFVHNQPAIPEARGIETPTFRHAAAAIEKAAAVILPEGGLHHASAMYQTRGVVLFGGFTPPEITGYRCHINLFTGGTACGSMKPCQHCAEAMAAISVDRVETLTRRVLKI